MVEVEKNKQTYKNIHTHTHVAYEYPQLGQYKQLITIVRPVIN